MSKKDNLPRNETPAPQQPVPAEPASERRPVSSGMIWTFWGAAAAAVIVARSLDAMLPQTPERVIERWVMVAFAAFLALFLLKFK